MREIQGQGQVGIKLFPVDTQALHWTVPRHALWTLWLCLPKVEAILVPDAEKVESKLPGREFCCDTDSSITITTSARAFNLIKPIFQLGIYVWA